ncbi:unnamed protein product [Rotaria magnacalcarata]|uniref:VWFA domain-containing protein n=2 Tax=Rotaria magnacalcarata TaxID=392030 RepID=A0A819E8Y7_9BILA|nr:unnamed protein product [Rotaria magnacalcarata]CAF2033348.1 unnamed protein product [Rotaria magnacalcarata]CAF2059247.1 unnamed protein product [Rotaria magnacalcarata]CAF2129451.1 unnamed protein product [Rotaria magnacalcarata]CAF3846033.1 unnamed protein product [Rotaria magnacalcarata]
MYPQQFPETSPSSPPPPYSNQTGFNSLQPTSGPVDSEERLRKFQYLVNRYEINRDFATRLRALEGYEIVFIVDDSGSMNTPLGDLAGPYDRNPTRWDELRQTVSIVVDIASVFDSDGIDIFFLNREPMRHVKSSDELVAVFTVQPQGPTPILRVLRHVLREKQLEIQERKLLILIATDGVPTNENGQQDTKSLEHALRHERNPINRIPVTIIACTDDNECIGYLNHWDKKIPNLDVADDYKSERQEIQKVQGKDFPFSFGDYVVKVLMGAVDSWFDTLDERPVTTSGPTGRRTNKAKSKSSCTIL